MAAVKAKEPNPALRVLLLEKANVKRSGAISMGMDGLNNAVIPGHATPEHYVDGDHHRQRRHRQPEHRDGLRARTASRWSQELDRWGVKFEKDEHGDYAVRKVHHMGTYVLPMPEGHDIKKVLYRQLQARARVRDHQPPDGRRGC